MKGLLVLAWLVCVGATDCNPMETACDAVDGLGTSIWDTFTKESNHYSEVNSVGVEYQDSGLQLTLSKRKENPSLKLDFYIMFGRVEVVMKAAPGNGIILSFYLQSDDMDEIDIELFGGNPYQFSSNFFSKGDTSTYDRGQYHSTGTSPLTNYHTYTIDWTENGIMWGVDDKPVRTVLASDPRGYPQSPMYIMMGLWAGGDEDNEQGTIEWAGGLTDFSKAPFSMYIKSLIVTDYLSGTKYSYTDQSGTWQSIEPNKGEVGDRFQKGKLEFLSLEKRYQLYVSTSTTASAILDGSYTLLDSNEQASFSYSYDGYTGHVYPTSLTSHVAESLGLRDYSTNGGSRCTVPYWMILLGLIA